MISKRTSRKHKFEHDADLPKRLRSLSLGAWRAVYAGDEPELFDWISILNFGLVLDFSEWVAAAQETQIPRYCLDVWRVGPPLALLYVLVGLLKATQEALELHCTNQLLGAIQAGFVNGTPDARRLAGALALRLSVVALMTCLEWAREKTKPILKDRIKSHFTERVVETHLGLDLLSAQEKSKIVEPSLPWVACEALDSLLDMFATAASTLSQLAVVWHILRTQEGGFVLVLLCLARPLYNYYTRQNLRDRCAFFYVNDPWYLRVKAMIRIATAEEHKQEVISGGMGPYIKQEYRQASQNARLSYDDCPPVAYNTRDTPFVDVLGGLIEDLPLVYFAYCAFLSPTRFSVVSLAILTQTSQALKFAFIRLSGYRNGLAERAGNLKMLYSALDVRPAFDLGTRVYPSSEKSRLGQGMHIEVANVTFQYPASGAVALRNVSFSIPASSLVVIVGENGSGKTSLVKLLAGLYRPASGSLTIDGIPAHEYKCADLARATALLTQEHTLFPVSVAENISVGDPGSDDMDRVREAARLGGALAFVEKLPAGFEEVLQPVSTAWSMSYIPASDHELKEVMDEVERKTDVSGGEKQRLAASRTFMRLTSGRIKLLMVDEPTSAMDPAGEFELFESLRSMRAGKTMVFVTHRFGHLTKHADLILCMKDGKLVESGTHRELIQKDGEYQRLYNIQAKAFVDEPPVTREQVV